jgi:hypothetical protein
MVGCGDDGDRPRGPEDEVTTSTEGTTATSEPTPSSEPQPGGSVDGDVPTIGNEEGGPGNAGNTPSEGRGPGGEDGDGESYPGTDAGSSGDDVTG